MPKMGDTTNRELIDYTKQQLIKGKLIPWRYREFGALAVEEMFYAKERIAS